MEKKNATVIIVVVGVLALFVGCTLGVLLGGAATYMITARAAEPTIIGPAIRVTPEFGVPTIPDMPVMPGGRMGEIYALVTVVTPGSPAEQAGIQVGDMITRFDGQPLDAEGPVTMITAYEPGDRVSVTVQRSDQELELPVTLGDNPNAPGKAWLGITYQAVSGGMDRFMTPDGD